MKFYFSSQWKHPTFHALAQNYTKYCDDILVSMLNTVFSSLALLSKCVQRCCNVCVLGIYDKINELKKIILNPFYFYFWILFLLKKKRFAFNLDLKNVKQIGFKSFPKDWT